MGMSPFTFLYVREHTMAQTPRTLAFLGLGAMGTRMVPHLVNAGHHVTVWNRTASRAEEIKGAHRALTPAEAVRGADLAIAMVRDDEASEEVWCHPKHGALDAMNPGAHIVESSTLTTGHVARLAARCAARGVHFFDAPVAGSLPQAEEAGLIYFVGGEAQTYRASIEPILAHMGSVLHYCGEPGHGARMKLVVNALFASQVAAMAELLCIFEGDQDEMSRAIDVLASTPVCSPAAAGASRAMAAQMYRAMFPIELVEKDLRYALKALTQHDATRHESMIAQARRIFSRASELGFGGDHITGVRQLFTSPHLT